MFRAAAILVVGVTLVGCTVGPDYRVPNAELPEVFVQASDNETATIPAADELWASFDDPQLNELIESATLRNTTIAQAVATLNETRALTGLTLFSWFPTVTVNAEQERSRQSAQDPFTFEGQNRSEIYRAGFDATWEIDLFGSLRRQSERIYRLAEADEATVYAVHLAIVAEVAQTYFQWQGDTHRLMLLRDSLNSQTESVRILEASLDAGRGTSLDVARARAVQQQVAAGIPLAKASQARAEQRMAVLTRVPVAEIRQRWEAHGNLPQMPDMVTTGSPVDWLLRRPDVQAAERRLAAATAGIGVELAEFYPKLELSGSFGWTGRQSGQIGDSDAARWRSVPALSWRIFDFGRVRQRVLAARAQTAGALAAYDETWLLAIEETENSLANYRAMSERVEALEIAYLEIGKASDLAIIRYDAGSDNYLSVLDADRSRIDIADQLIQAKTDRATALAALYKSLGGDFTRLAPTG